MTTILIQEYAGAFAENKDIAQKLRLDKLHPALQQGAEITLDFSGVTGATQSFIHALISELMREYGSEALDKILFKSCNKSIQKIILIVTDYLQESWK